MNEEDFRALHVAVVQENAIREGRGGECKLQGNVFTSRLAHACQCGVDFKSAEEVRVHVFPQLRGRDPTFMPRRGDAVMTKDGKEWDVAGCSGLDVVVDVVGGGIGVVHMGLGHFRLMCGIEHGGTVLRYAEDGDRAKEQATRPSDTCGRGGSAA